MQEAETLERSLRKENMQRYILIPALAVALLGASNWTSESHTTTLPRTNVTAVKVITTNGHIRVTVSPSNTISIDEVRRAPSADLARSL